tara:strand:- start:513 stop:731 length:219 start_codon:yes stop_codon:yes gene_type:complete
MRALTVNERAVLAHMVVDPDAWWAHANAKDGSDGKREIDHEVALAEKVTRWQADYDTALAAGNYQTRAERET